MNGQAERTEEDIRAEVIRLKAELVQRARSGGPESSPHRERPFRLCVSPDQIEALLARCGAPARHLGTTQHRGARWTVAKDRVLGVVGSGAIVGLVGGRGTGKTQIAIEAMRRAIAGGQDDYGGHPGPYQFTLMQFLERYARYATAMEVFMAIKRVFAAGSTETELSAMEVWTRPKLLVIDECQERGETEWENRMLTHIIDRRYGAKLDTVLISNLTSEAFAASMGESVIDRLRETGTLIVCDWPSFRAVTA